MMTVDGSNREKELFEQALEQGSAGERLAYLRGACGADAALLARVQVLLQAHEADAGFLPVEPVAQSTVVIVTEKPGDRIGRYKLLQKVGEGGCGVVYMAEQEEPVRRRVAIKVIKLGMDTKQVIARFEAERQALAMMAHPNIAKVLDAGATDTGRPYFVMELVRGVKITEYCDQNNLPTRQRLDLFVPICQAIQHAHQKGIIHRDIKPSNILVTLHDGVPVPKVIDFGIAKATEGRLTDQTLFTALEQFIGTPAYMSPEQAEMSGLDIDTRSDIYSLGVLLYELLTGKTPFEAKELLEVGLDELRRTIREKEPVRPSTRLLTMLELELTAAAKRRGSEVPKLINALRGDLDWIVMKALEKDRTRRYETANNLAADVQRHLHNEPVVARPPSRGYRLRKLVRRNRLAFAAGTTVAASLVFGILVSTWQAVRAKRAERQQIILREKAVNAEETAQAEAQRAEQQRNTALRNAYAASMVLAQTDWDNNYIGRLRQLLDETKESPSRGFEWYYWQRLTHLDLKTLRGHLKRISSVAFSPDGQRIVTGSLDKTAKVWDAASGKELYTLRGHRADITSATFSPDGQRIVTGSWDKTAKVWEAASGKELLTLQGHNAEVTSAAFSADGKRIVTGSVDKTAKVWDAASGKELLTLKGHASLLWSVAFSPDGQRIVTGSGDQTARVWEADSGRELLTLLGHTDDVASVAFSPDGQRIVTGSETAKVWDVASGKALLTLNGHNAPIDSVAFSPDGQRIVTGSGDRTAKVWDVASGKELLTLKGHSGIVFSVAFSPDGQRIATGSEDQTAKIWNATNARETLSFSGHSGEILSVVFSPNGQQLATGSYDRTAKMWDAATGKELLTLKGHRGWIWSVAFSPDGQRIATGSSDQTAKVWDAATGKELFTLNGHSDAIRSVAFSPDGQRLATGSFDQTTKVWDVATGTNLLTLKGHHGKVFSVAYSPDGHRIVTGSGDHTAKIWESVSGKELLTLKSHSDEVVSIAFSPDGQRLVTGSLDKTAKVWDMATGTNLLTLKGQNAIIWAVAFSPDGQRIVTGSGYWTAKVWEAVSGKELLTLKGHNGEVVSVAFSPDGQRVVTGSRDKTAQVWEAARAEQVAAWQEEERVAGLHLTALLRQHTADEERQKVARLQDEGAIKRWLILAPIPLAPGRGGAEALDLEQIEGEAQLRPTAGQTRSVQGDELKWREVALEGHEIDFNEIQGHQTERSVAYAVCYIRSEVARRGLQMLVGSDDEAKVYLNGKPIHKSGLSRNWMPDQDTVPDIALQEGVNVLVFKVVNEVGGWQGSIRFTDAQGNPVQGIKVTLTPP
jgi:WD40 repeat protein/serine/threonine protein kinase